MNQLTSIPRLHTSNPAHRNYNVFTIHGSRILEERGPVIQTFPTSRRCNNCRKACNKNVGCVFPRK